MPSGGTCQLRLQGALRWESSLRQADGGGTAQGEGGEE